jgi:hypothetical protein
MQKTSNSRENLKDICEKIKEENKGKKKRRRIKVRKLQKAS